MREPKAHTLGGFSRLANKQTRANGDDVIMPAPACIDPTWPVIPGHTRSATWRAEKDNFFAPSPIPWRTGKEQCVNSLARDAAKDCIAMLCSDTWGYCTQHGVEDSRKLYQKILRRLAAGGSLPNRAKRIMTRATCPIFSTMMQERLCRRRSFRSVVTAIG